MFLAILMALPALDKYFQNKVILSNTVLNDGSVEAESKKNTMSLGEVTQNTELSTKSTKKTYT
jgi:hypothetical protein